MGGRLIQHMQHGHQKWNDYQFRDWCTGLKWAIYDEILSIQPISSEAYNQSFWSGNVGHCWTDAALAALLAHPIYFLFVFPTYHQALVCLPPTHSTIQCALHHKYVSTVVACKWHEALFLHKLPLLIDRFWTLCDSRNVRCVFFFSFYI